MGETQEMQSTLDSKFFFFFFAFEVDLSHLRTKTKKL